MIRTEVVKQDTESTGGLVRRFTKKMQAAGTLRRVKSNRFWERPRSDFVRKKNALRRMARLKEIEKLKKLGKIKDGFRTKGRK
jgi:ribosomal protein S21